MSTPDFGSAHARPPKVRLAVFGSFYRGYHLLQEMLNGSLNSWVKVVGVATDNPDYSFVSPHKRVWQYPHERHEELMVRRCAESAYIEVYDGRVKTPEFYNIFENRWQPEICIMGTFGQRIDVRLYEFPRLGFYNLHPCLHDHWPSRYVGGNPFSALLAERKDYAVIAMHRVDADFDTRELIAYSERFYFPEPTNVVDMHKITAPAAARLAARELQRIIADARPSGT